MKTAWKRTGAVLVSWLLLCLLALSASAVGPLEVGVAFWKDSKGEQTSLANDGIDTDRAATLTRQANGTYTLELPLKKLSRINITGRLSGLTIGDVTYDGTLSGNFDDDTALLTIKNLPASVLTGSAGRDLQSGHGCQAPGGNHHSRAALHLGRKVKHSFLQQNAPQGW